jgi:hypothetical protein
MYCLAVSVVTVAVVRLVASAPHLLQIVALHHAVHSLPDGSSVIWADVDTEMNHELDQEWFTFTRSRDISYIAEAICRNDLAGVDTIADLPEYCKDWRLESGVMSWTVSDKTRRLLRAALQW